LILAGLLILALPLVLRGQSSNAWQDEIQFEPGCAGSGAELGGFVLFSKATNNFSPRLPWEPAQAF